jgi:DNA-directed RNA polymerase subunit M/transcription elongation factor TFIIS
MAVTIREHAEITRQSRALVDYPISANECIRGHELEGDNLYLPPGSNKRRCRQCRNDFEKKKQAIIRLQVKLMTPFLESTQACLNGHPRTPDSTYMFRGKIFCRECHNEASRTYYERIRKAANEERLRSDSFPANSKFKTHCKRNHDLMDPDNLIRTVTGRRSCRTCALEAMRRRRELNREQMNRRKREAYQKKVREAEDKRLAEQEALDLADKAKKATGSE